MAPPDPPPVTPTPAEALAAAFTTFLQSSTVAPSTPTISTPATSALTIPAQLNLSSRFASLPTTVSSARSAVMQPRRRESTQSLAEEKILISVFFYLWEGSKDIERLNGKKET
jgi:hypothetical protein